MNSRNALKIEIIILNWNQEENTLECLASLRRCHYRNYEIIVVDNGSTRGLPERIKQKFPEILLIKNERNLGFAGGNNVGLRYALERGSDYFLLLNNDTVVDSDLLAELVKAASLDSKIGVVGGRNYHYFSHDDIWQSGGIIDWRSGNVIDATAGKVDTEQFNVNREVDDVPGSCLLIKREVIEKIGLLEEKFFCIYEETDWCMRAKRSGYKVISCYSAKIWHKVSTSKSPEADLYFLIRNKPLFMLRNCDRKILFSFFVRYFFEVLRQIRYLISRGEAGKGYAVWKGFSDFLIRKYGAGNVSKVKKVAQKTGDRFEHNLRYRFRKRVCFFLKDSCSSPFDLGVHWLLSTQYSQGEMTGFLPGGTTRLERDRAYPEITGYGASTFAKLFLLTHKEGYLSRSKMASDALLRFMQPSGSVPGVIHRDGTFDDLVYSFDQGMIALGLLDTYNATSVNGEELDKYRESGLKAVDFLLRVQAKEKEKTLPVTTRLDGGNPSQQSYSIMTKVILPFLRAYEITKDKKYLQASVYLGDYAINNYQDENGAFQFSKLHLNNRVHYHCYVLQGLIDLYDMTEDRRYFDAMKKGADFLLNIQKQDGGFWNVLSSDKYNDNSEDIPPAAQAIAIWLYLYRLNQEDKYLLCSKKAMEYLKKRQYRLKLGRLYGGVPLKLPSRTAYACTWSMEFVLDAFCQYEELLGIVNGERKNC